MSEPVVLNKIQKKCKNRVGFSFEVKKLRSPTYKLYLAIADAEELHGPYSLEAAVAHQNLFDFCKSKKNRSGQKDCIQRLRWIVTKKPELVSIFPLLKNYVRRSRLQN